MKKILSLLALIFIAPMLTACEVSNTDLANSLEGNMTRLVYSVGYLDSISTEELSNLVNNSSYFTHSSLYTNPNSIAPTENTSTLTTDTTPSPLDGGISTNNNILSISSTPYRTRTYKSPLLNNTSAVDGEDITTNVGVVDMSLLETSSNDLNNILLEISSKRGIIMLYCTDLRSGRASLSANDKKAIHEYDNIIQETTNYLNNTTGALVNQFNGISSISTTENSAELINAKLIRANEVLKTRYAKLDTCLDALDAIINILVNNIGFDYATMYNNQTTNNASLVTNQNNTLSNTAIDSTNNSATTETEIVTENTAPTNNICPVCKREICICNNSKNCPNCNQQICICDDENTISTPNKTTSDNTIINYNYDGQNSSNITTPSASTYPINRPQADTIVNNNTSPTDNAVSSELTSTEIALNGGLVRGVNSDKINENNANNFIINSSTPSAGSLTKDHKTNPNLTSYTHPFKTLEETTHNFPITQDLRDEEFIESEKELTPEILPFTGIEESKSFKTNELKNSKLAFINILPFQYEEDDVLKKIPKL